MNVVVRSSSKACAVLIGHSRGRILHTAFRYSSCILVIVSVLEVLSKMQILVLVPNDLKVFRCLFANRPII